MTFAYYWTVIIKRWQIIALCFLTVGLGAYIVSRHMTPLYQSAATLQVSARTDTALTDYVSSNSLTQTEAQLATSEPVLREVASHYPNLSVDQLARSVTSTARLNTELFEIDVLDTSPTRAAMLANDIATTLIKQQFQLAQSRTTQSQQQIQQDLADTLDQIHALGVQVGHLQEQEKALAIQQSATQDSDQLNTLSELRTKITNLQSQMALLQEQYHQEQGISIQIKVAEAKTGQVLWLVQTAQANPSPVRPQILLNTAAGFIVGLLLGILLAILFEQLDTRVRDIDTATGLLQLPALGTTWKTDINSVVKPKPGDVNFEAYRTLRTNIGFATAAKSMRSLLVTSALPGEGKSVVAANLAIFMARTGKNTLLVDANLRHPSVHEKFGLSVDAPGLGDALVTISQHIPADVSYDHSNSPSHIQQFSLDPFIHSVDILGLRVISVGSLSPDVSDLLDSKAMDQLLQKIMNSNAELIIFDVPSLLDLSDASTLVTRLDATLLVVDATRADKNHLGQAKALLMNSGACTIGYVMNKRRKKSGDQMYYNEIWSTIIEKRRNINMLTSIENVKHKNTQKEMKEMVDEMANGMGR
jgi:tyrosine-protein kinase